MAKHLSYSTLGALRTALGLSTTQIAARLGVHQSTFVRLEQSEARGAASLSTLKNAANALGFDLHYEFVPHAELQAPKGRRTRVRPSAVASELDAREITYARQQSPMERILRSCEITDTVRVLKRCSKKFS